MKLNNISNRISVNKVIDCNFFNNRIGKQKNAKLMRRIFSNILLFAPYEFENIISTEMYSGAFSPEHLFYTIHNEEYIKGNSTHSARLRKIKKTLKDLSKTYNSMYGKRKLISESKGNFYVSNFKKDYNRLGYSKLNVGTCDMTHEMIHKYDEKPEDYITAAIITEACQNNVIFNFQQIENIFGITKARIKAVFKRLDITTYNQTRSLCATEKMAYGLSRYSNDEITDGVVILATSDDYKEVINDFNIQINYNTLLGVRNFFIKNSKIVKKDSFKTDYKELTKEEFDTIINSDDANSKSVWNRTDMDVNLNNTKKVEKQNLFLSHGSRDWDKDKNCDAINSNGTGMVPERESDSACTVDFITYPEFCEISRNEFKEFCEKTGKVSMWREFKQSAIDTVNECIIMSDSEKKKILSAYDAVIDNTDVMTSPLFVSEWKSYCDSADHILKMLYISLCSDYINKATKNPIEEIDFVGIINGIDQEYNKDIKSFDKTEYINKIKTELNGRNLNTTQQEIVCNRSDLMQNKKECEAHRVVLTFEICFRDVMTKEHTDLAAMEAYARQRYVICMGHGGEYYRSIFREIEEKDLKLILQYFNIDCNDINFKNNIDMLETIRYYKRPEKKSDKVRSELTQRLAEKGLMVEYSHTLGSTIRTNTMLILMGKKTIDDVVKELVSELY